MWDEQQGQRFQELRDREAEGQLSPDEQVELEQLITTMESAEASYLQRAAERMRAERQLIEAQNRDLEELVTRREKLASRLHSLIAEAQAERQSISEELGRILGRTGTIQSGSAS